MTSSEICGSWLVFEATGSRPKYTRCQRCVPFSAALFVGVIPVAVTVKFSDGCLAVADARVFCNSRPQLAEALLQQLQQLPQVSFASLNLSQGFCRIGWQSDLTAKQAADGFIAALRMALLQERGGKQQSRFGWFRRRRQPLVFRAALSEHSQADVPSILTGPKRLLYLAAGGGSVLMTIVGVIVPGIPTVPFLLASSYFLARSSPRAHALLEATPLFGDMVREWDAHQALSRTSKRRLAIFTLVIIGFTVVLAGPSLLVLGVVSVMAPACLIGIIRLPEIEDLSGRMNDGF